MWRYIEDCHLRAQKKGLEQLFPSQPLPNPANVLIWDFWSPKLWGNEFLLLEPHSLWFFVTAALANAYRKKPCPVFFGVGGGFCLGEFEFPKREGLLLYSPGRSCLEESLFPSPLLWEGVAHGITTLGCRSLTVGPAYGTLLSLGLSRLQTPPPLHLLCFLAANCPSQAAHSRWLGDSLPPGLYLGSIWMESIRSSSVSGPSCPSVLHLQWQCWWSDICCLRPLWGYSVVQDCSTWDRLLRVYLI